MKHRLAALFRPRSVAIVGASPNRSGVGGRILAHLEQHGYTGRILLVNPRYQEIGGHPVVPTVSELEDIPDVAVVAVPAAASVDAVEQLALHGVPNVVLLASGFDEAGATGSSLAERLRDAAGTVNLIGPNSQGFWSIPARLVLAFGSEAERDDLVQGPVAVVAHSGSLGGAVTRRLQDLGVGIRYWVSSGNEIGLTMADYLEFFLADADVKVVALYVEAVRDGQCLIRLLDQAHNAAVDVVVLQAGVGVRGRAMTASHTGRMAAAPRRYAEIFAQHGALVVGTVRDLVAASALLASTSRRVPEAGALGMLGISGGMLALMADACEARGFELPSVCEATRERLRVRLPSYAVVENPVDLTSAVLGDEQSLPDCLEAMAADPLVDAVVVGFDNRGYARVERGADEFAAIAARSAKPLVLALWDAPTTRSTALDLSLLRSGVVVADDPIDVAVHLGHLRIRTRATPAALPRVEQRFSVERLQTWAGQIDFAHAVSLQTPETIVLDGGHALSREDFRHLAGPVVVKPLPSRIAHKSDRGLVITGLTTYEEAASAAVKVAAATDHLVPVLVQQQVTGVEVLLATTIDPDWGPVLTLGAGGALVEVLEDTFAVSVPCAASDLRVRLARLRLHRLLAGYRGQPEADVDALVEVACRLQAFGADGVFSELELNPVLVAPNGGGAFMIDLLAR